VIVQSLAREPAAVEEGADDCRDDFRRHGGPRQFAALLGSLDHRVERGHEAGVDAGVDCRDFRIALRGVDHRGCRESFAADFVLFVGPFAKYDREYTNQAAPVSHAALVGQDVARIVDFTFLGDKTLDKSRAAKIALNLLRLHLLRGDKPDEARP
jgi:hypothetical protein